MPILTIHDSDFETNVCASSAPVLLDFWAGWCTPCRMLAPILEEVSAAKPDLLIGKINVEEEPELAERFQILSIPT
ncbi:MAG: thioredoxin family protein, partial [Lachnospiraceae bacterium]